MGRVSNEWGPHCSVKGCACHVVAEADKGR